MMISTLRRITPFLYVDSMPNSCISCGKIKSKGSKMSMFQFPSDKVKREQWLEALCLTEDDITESSRICSRHFFSGDSSNLIPH